MGLGLLPSCRLVSGKTSALRDLLRLPGRPRPRPREPSRVLSLRLLLLSYRPAEDLESPSESEKLSSLYGSVRVCRPDRFLFGWSSSRSPVCLSRDGAGDLDRLPDNDLDLVARPIVLDSPALATSIRESDALVDIVATDELEADETDLGLFLLARSWPTPSNVSGFSSDSTSRELAATFALTGTLLRMLAGKET